MTSQLPSWNPRSYQKEGLKLMVGQACAGLLLRPGFGKTTVTYALYLLLKRFDPKLKLLVVAPLRVARLVWPVQRGEWSDFAHLRVGVLHGSDKERVLASDDYDIYVINPEGLEWLLQAKLLPDRKTKAFTINAKRIEKFGMLVVDESTKFKNHSTTRFKLMKHMVPKFRRRYILTGTIVPNGLMDLFGQIYILDEGAALGAFITHFRKKFFIEMADYEYVPQPDALERITEKIRPLCYFIDPKDVNDLFLPELIIDDIKVELPPDVMKKYRYVRRHLVYKDDERTVISASQGVNQNKLRQIASGFIYDESKVAIPLHTEKIEALGNLLEQLQGAPLLIGYEYEWERDAIAAAYDIPYIGRDHETDARLVQMFRRGELRALMGNFASIALGLDGLQRACKDICCFTIPWNLEWYIQFIDRVRRQGNDADSVVLHRLIAMGTKDEDVAEVLLNKDITQEEINQALAKTIDLEGQ